MGLVVRLQGNSRGFFANWIIRPKDFCLWPTPPCAKYGRTGICSAATCPGSSNAAYGPSTAFEDFFSSSACPLTCGGAC